MTKSSFALLVATLVCWCTPVGAQVRTVKVGSPPGYLAQFLKALAPGFEASTGIAVRIVTLSGDSGVPTDATLVPARLAPRTQAEPQVVFKGDAVLVGSRADRARIRGLRDMKAAFRWIASSRAFYVASSSALGLREIELELWSAAGVNVRAPLTWYEEVEGDEPAVLRRASRTGAYTLVHRATWLTEDDRGGLEIIAAGDPALHVPYVSALQSASSEAMEWHAWLQSEKGAAAIAAWRVNGVQVFTPARSGSQHLGPT
jgi:tungstate transport system substrate-binding protein